MTNCEQLKSEEYEQDHPTRIETINTEKQEPLNETETQNPENQNTTDPSSTKQILTQEDKINVLLIKKIITEKKIHYYPSRTKTGKSQGKNRERKQIVFQISQHH